MGHGILVARVEYEQRLWRGMKDRHMFVVPDIGSWEFLYRGATYLQDPGMVQLKYPGEIYRDLRRDGPASYDLVLLDPEILDQARRARSAADIAFSPPQLPVGDPRAAALLALRRMATAAVPPLAIETAIVEAAQLLISLGTSERTAGHEARAVRRAKAYLLEHLAGRVRLDDLADHVGLDKFHLIRSFRTQVGVPPYEFLIHARVHRARELLRGGASAGSAATTVGFCDQSQLHRHFVRLVGVTPGRYAARERRSHQISTAAANRAAASRAAARRDTM